MTEALSPMRAKNSPRQLSGCHPISIKLGVAGGARNTIRPLTHSLEPSKEGLAVDATQTPEEWRPVLNWEGLYEASSWGRIRSLERVVTYPAGGKRTFPSVVLRISLTKGYPHVTLKRQGHYKNAYVHTLVSEAFYGPRPLPTHEVRHLDGNPLNCHMDNLRWGTKTENSLDTVRHGKHKETKKTQCVYGHKFDVFQTNPQGRLRRSCSICHQRRLKRWAELRDASRRCQEASSLDKREREHGRKANR